MNKDSLYTELTKFHREVFQRIEDYGLTQEMEKELHLIEDSVKGWERQRKLYTRFEKFIRNREDDVKCRIERIKREDDTTMYIDIPRILASHRKKKIRDTERLKEISDIIDSLKDDILVRHAFFLKNLENHEKSIAKQLKKLFGI